MLHAMDSALGYELRAASVGMKLARIPLSPGKNGAESIAEGIASGSVADWLKHPSINPARLMRGGYRAFLNEALIQAEQVSFYEGIPLEAALESRLTHIGFKPEIAKALAPLVRLPKQQPEEVERALTGLYQSHALEAPAPKPPHARHPYRWEPGSRQARRRCGSGSGRKARLADEDPGQACRLEDRRHRRRRGRRRLGHLRADAPRRQAGTLQRNETLRFQQLAGA